VGMLASLKVTTFKDASIPTFGRILPLFQAFPHHLDKIGESQLLETFLGHLCGFYVGCP